MRTRNWTIAVALTFAFFCVARAAQEMDEWLNKLRSQEPAVRDQAVKEALASRKTQIQALLRIVNDRGLRETNRPAVVTAVKLLGNLRAEEASAALADLLLFGERADIHASLDEELKDLLPPDTLAPAVAALIKIGVPSLKPVTKQLLSISDENKDKDVLCYHCLWVIKGVLGPRLGKAYLEDLASKDKAAAQSEFVNYGIKFMDTYAKTAGE
jgi:hypothetical protein